MKKHFAAPLFTFLFLISLGTSAWASGLSKPVNVGAKAIGMGGAFSAIADDPTAIYHNPAGLTQSKKHAFYLGMDGIITQEDYMPAGGAPTESADREFLPTVNFAYTTAIAKPVYFGLGVFFPHGNGGKYETASSIVTNPNEGRIYSMEIAPAVAWKAFSDLSLGFSLRIIRVSNSLKGQLISIPGVGIDTLDDLDLSAWGVAPSAGFLYKPCKEFSLGATYRAPVELSLGGNAAFAASGTLPVEMGFTLPTLVMSSMAFHPMNDLTLSVGYSYERNSEIESFDVTSAAAGLALSLPQNWDDSHTVHFGAEYWLTEALGLRAGYAKDFNESIPNEVMNRVVGDIAAHDVSGGLAFNWSKYSLQATYNARFGDRTIPLNAVNVAPGEYEAIVQTISVGVGVEL